MKYVNGLFPFSSTGNPGATNDGENDWDSVACKWLIPNTYKSPV